MELLSKLYAIHSKSGEEKSIRDYVAKCCRNLGANTSVDKAGNLYAVKGKAKSYPCVVSHLDQVQTLHSADFKVKIQGDVIYGFSESSRGMQGLGADDKNGIWICLKALAKFSAIKVAFFVGEEIGCVGSSSANMEFFNNCRFVLQCDRRGSSDLITSVYSSSLCGKDFLDDVDAEKFGYKEASGMLTDVYTLKTNGLGVSCVNISCGYYSPHTDHEVTVISDLKNCLDFVFHIIANCTRVYKHDYVAPVWKAKTYSGYGSYCSGHYGSFGGSFGNKPDSDYGDPLYSRYEDDYLAAKYGQKDVEEEEEKKTTTSLSVVDEKDETECLEDDALDELYEVLERNPFLDFNLYWQYYGQYWGLKKKAVRKLYNNVFEDLRDFYMNKSWS